MLSADFLRRAICGPRAFGLEVESLHFMNVISLRNLRRLKIRARALCELSIASWTFMMKSDCFQIFEKP
jgi:hypothetical protein